MQTETEDSSLSGKPVLELKVWKEHCGMPSIDPLCIELMTLMKMNDMPFHVKHSSIPFLNIIPSLKCGDMVETDYRLIHKKIVQLSLKYVDGGLDESTNFRLYVYKNYFIDAFLPAFYDEMWLKDANSQHSLRFWYNTIIPFPLNRIYTRKRINYYTDFYFCRTNKIQNLNEYNNSIYESARQYLEDINGLLDGQTYILGSSPTSLDALVYSYLVVTLAMHLPEGRLKSFLHPLENIIRYVRGMSQIYHPSVLSTTLSFAPPVKQNDDLSLTSLALAGLAVVSIMMWYASTKS